LCFARHVGSRMIFMDGGKIVEDRPPNEMIADPTNLRNSSILSCSIEAPG
jgi:ABC-type polar amino acid transport system ATPase subunit